jgi:hypothetical protein
MPASAAARDWVVPLVKVAVRPVLATMAAAVSAKIVSTNMITMTETRAEPRSSDRLRWDMCRSRFPWLAGSPPRRP